MARAQRYWLPILALALGGLLGYLTGRESAFLENNTAPGIPVTTSSRTSLEVQNLRQDLSGERETSKPTIRQPGGYLARLELHSPEEIEQALTRAEALHQKLSESNLNELVVKPLSLVIHGPEVEVFFGKNYSQYKSIVDLAARLSAFNVVDVKVCQTRIDHLTQEKPLLPPFIEEVPSGPAEIERLVENEAFVYF